MMADDKDTPADTRLTVSLSTLRAELVSMELRLVDRLNGALATKAERAALDEVADRLTDTRARLTVLEQRAVTQDHPIMAEIDELRQANISLAEVGKYKKWLWAQTIALVSVAAGILLWIIDHYQSGSA